MNGCGWFGREIRQGMARRILLIDRGLGVAIDRVWGREGVEGVEEWWSRAALDPSLIRSLAPSLLHLSLSLSLSLSLVVVVVVVVVLFCSVQA